MSNRGDAKAKIRIEVCTASVQGALEAELAGADRIELNSALELDGLTPSAGLFGLVTDTVRLPIIAMARPRPGNFSYSDSEWKTLIADARWLLDQGADGIAFGCLLPDGQVDLQRCREMRSLTGTHELVFHKAFDVVVDWRNGLERLIEAGINRVMTSGQQPTALEGVTKIAQIAGHSAGRIEVLPAGGIGSKNAVNIVDQTGCDQLHGSFSSGQSGDVKDEIRRVISQLASRSNAS